MQVDAERRHVLRAFLTASEDYFVELVKLAKADAYQPPSRTFEALNAAKAEVALFALGDSLIACEELQQALREYHNAVKAFHTQSGGSAESREKHKRIRDDKYRAAKKAFHGTLTRVREQLLARALGSDERSALERLYKLPEQEDSK